MAVTNRLIYSVLFALVFIIMAAIDVYLFWMYVIYLLNSLCCVRSAGHHVHCGGGGGDGGCPFVCSVFIKPVIFRLCGSFWKNRARSLVVRVLPL